MFKKMTFFQFGELKHLCWKNDMFQKYKFVKLTWFEDESSTS